MTARLIFLFLTLSIFMILMSIVSAQSPAKEVLIIRAGKLLDVRNGRMLSDQAILIEGERIKEVGPFAQISAIAGAHILDLSRATVLPGLIDCHTHLTGDPSHLGYSSLSISAPREALYGAKNAKVTLEAGFTSVRNVGAGGYSDIALRDAINAGDIPGPRISASGPAIGVTGGHADQNLLAPEFHYKELGIADGVPALIEKTRENIKYGADCIKVIATGGVLSKGDSPS